MQNFFRFIRRMNVLLWVLGLFVGHALLYLLLGTDSWLATSLLAASFYGVLLLLLKIVARRGATDEEEVR